MNKVCIKCGVLLELNKNITLSRYDKHYYICKTCVGKKSAEIRYKNGGKPMSKNKSCTNYLGIHITERMIASVFNTVKQMPPNNPGYDFICDENKKIDVKSACISINNRGYKILKFAIKYNNIPDYFLCVGFNNRSDLTPINIWLIPSKVVNNISTLTMYLTDNGTKRWDKYIMDMVKINTYCNNIDRND